MHSHDESDNIEASIWPVDEQHEIDLARSGLVLVDTWNNHPIRSHLDATAAVMRDRIAPLLTAARTAGLPLFFAPSPDVAVRYPQWQARFSGRPGAAAPPPSWPPPELRGRTGEWARYRRRQAELPEEEHAAYFARTRWDGIASSVAPRGDEAVVATGHELHELLAERRIAFLFYVGFATNICVLHRDYGVLAMGARGYLPVLLRDCTVGIETRDTRDGMLTTRMAIHDVERRYYSADSGELVRELSRS